MTTDPGDLVLDPTCGSGTTAYVAEQWGRRWITCDTSRVALALARTRLMAAKFPYYYLAADFPQLGPTATDEEIKQVLRTPVLSTQYRHHPLSPALPAEGRGPEVEETMRAEGREPEVEWVMYAAGSFTAAFRTSR
jgi:SAM-dependent methyltransferase